MRARVFTRERRLIKRIAAQLTGLFIAASHFSITFHQRHAHARAQQSVFSANAARHSAGVSFWRLSRQRARSFLIFVFIWHFHQASSSLSSPLASPSLFRSSVAIVRGDPAAPPPTWPRLRRVSVSRRLQTTTAVRAENRCKQYGEKMSSCVTFSVFLGTLLIIATIPDAASFSKYGRTCKDIGCPSDQVCVMAEDPCNSYSDDKCGRYPTCQKTSGLSCASMVCGHNEYCKNENGAPQCVRKSTESGYESAGVSYVNGERVAAGNNANPYANANAPPAPADPAGGYHRTSGSNLGYPPYPSNTGSSGSSGYPNYPQSTNQAGHRDLGYPPYPTQNRMPMPGQQPYPGYPQAPAGHPGNYPQQYPGYQGQPGYQNYPNQNQPRGYGYNTNSVYRRNGAAATGAFTSTTVLVGLAGLLLLLLETTL